MFTSTDERIQELFDTLCTVYTRQHNIHNACAIVLDHHVYDQLSGTCVNRKSQPQPFIKLTIQAVPADFQTLGFPLHIKPRPVTISTMADTGSQSCLADIKIMQQLGLQQSDLIPVSMRCMLLTTWVSRSLEPLPFDLLARTYTANQLRHVS